MSTLFCICFPRCRANCDQILLRGQRDANFASHAKKKYTLGDKSDGLHSEGFLVL